MNKLLEAPAIPAHLIDSCNSKVWAIAWETAIKEALRQAVQDADHIPDVGKMVYVPMTDDELGAIWEKDKSKYIVSALSAVERAVIERLGLVWGD